MRARPRSGSSERLNVSCFSITHKHTLGGRKRKRLLQNGKKCVRQSAFKMHQIKEKLQITNVMRCGHSRYFMCCSCLYSEQIDWIKMRWQHYIERWCFASSCCCCCCCLWCDVEQKFVMYNLEHVSAVFEKPISKIRIRLQLIFLMQYFQKEMMLKFNWNSAHLHKCYTESGCTDNIKWKIYFSIRSLWWKI